jgi:hypothetical protein
VVCCGSALVRHSTLRCDVCPCAVWCSVAAHPPYYSKCIAYKTGTWVLADSDSANGVFLGSNSSNLVKISKGDRQAAQLNDGAWFALGGFNPRTKVCLCTAWLPLLSWCAAALLGCPCFRGMPLLSSALNLQTLTWSRVDMSSLATPHQSTFRSVSSCQSSGRTCSAARSTLSTEESASSSRGSREAVHTSSTPPPHTHTHIDRHRDLDDHHRSSSRDQCEYALLRVASPTLIRDRASPRRRSSRWFTP